MKKLTLRRFLSDLNATYGVIYEDVPLAVTLELPWLNNESNKSCIPAGTYTCKKKIFPKHGETFEVTDVPGRSAILIHKGNVPADVKGCVLLGSFFGDFSGICGVGDSGKAYSEFWKRYLNDQEIELTILSA